MSERQITVEQIEAAETMARVDDSVVRAALARVPPSWSMKQPFPNGGVFRRGVIQVIYTVQKYEDGRVWVHASAASRTGLPECEGLREPESLGASLVRADGRHAGFAGLHDGAWIDMSSEHRPVIRYAEERAYPPAPCRVLMRDGRPVDGANISLERYAARLVEDRTEKRPVVAFFSLHPRQEASRRRKERVRQPKPRVVRSRAPRADKKDIPADWLRECLAAGMTCREMAKEKCCDPSLITKRLRMAGIDRLPTQQALATAAAMRAVYAIRRTALANPVEADALVLDRETGLPELQRKAAAYDRLLAFLNSIEAQGVAGRFISPREIRDILEGK